MAHVPELNRTRNIENRLGRLLLADDTRLATRVQNIGSYIADIWDARRALLQPAQIKSYDP